MPDTDKSVSALVTNGHVLDKSKTNPLENSSGFTLQITFEKSWTVDNDLFRIYLHHMESLIPLDGVWAIAKSFRII